MKVGYHVKNDASKEIIKKGVFPRMVDAINTFAKLKNMSTEDFLKLFAVVKLEE
tara:strand:+ start:337 stop:498 length:162 start_codon:yes stop_codon:yes gene_type:complete